MTRPQVVCVLGMHRSGTSVVTRILNLLGLCLGSEEHLLRPSPTNLKGYWEHAVFSDISETILSRLGGSWHEPPIFAPGWESAAELADLRARARAVIRDDFAAAGLWGWKDPRTCLTLPFWRPLVGPMRYVICLRNPVDVARSLELRDGFPPQKSARLWLTHVTSALAHTTGQPRLFTFFEDFLGDWRGQTQRLAGFLGRRDAAGQADVADAVREFIDDGLRHHRSSIVDAADNPGLPFAAKALYMVLRLHVRSTQGAGLAAEDEIEQALDTLGRWSEATQAYLEKTQADLEALRADLERREVQVAAHEPALAHLRVALQECRAHAAWMNAHPLWRAYLGIRVRLIPQGSKREAMYWSVRRWVSRRRKATESNARA